jgi:hypothetical protein
MAVPSKHILEISDLPISSFLHSDQAALLGAGLAESSRTTLKAAKAQ